MLKMLLRFFWPPLHEHNKRYVAITDTPLEAPDGRPMSWQCGHGWSNPRAHCAVCGTYGQSARWVCECGTMGIDHLMRAHGVFKIEFGRVVPDVKRWANEA